MIAGACALVPWTAYLAVTLPGTYQAQDWTLTWVGFDAALMIMLGLTALATRTQHRLAGLAGMATAMLLVSDAWFDWTTSSGADHVWATWTALLVELPTAALLIINAVRTSQSRPVMARSSRTAVAART